LFLQNARQAGYKTYFGRRCQWPVVWLDCDREGENISYEVIGVLRVCGCALGDWLSYLNDLSIRLILSHSELSQEAQNKM